MACDRDCRERCGNEQVDAGEVYDDGNQVDTDAYTSACRNATWGRDPRAGPRRGCAATSAVMTGTASASTPAATPCQLATCGDGPA